MRLLIVFAFSLLLGAGLQAQRNQPLRVELPDLRIGQETSIRLDFFDVEPQIKPEEVEFFRELLPLIEQQPAAAAARLSNEIGPDSSAALSYVLGNLYVQSQRLPQAINAYEQAISKYNEYRRAHKNLGMVHFQNGDLDRALEHLTRAVQLGDRDASNYGRLAYIYLQQDNPVAAESAYRSAIVVEPNKRDWKLGLAQTLMAQGRNQEVIAIMEPLIQADPQNAQLWLFQTNAYLGQNELEDAAINLEIIRRLGEAQASQLKLLGNIYLRSDMPQRALQTFMEVLNLDNPSENLDIAIDAAELFVRLNRYDEASQLINALQNADVTVSEEQEMTLLQLQAQIARYEGNTEAAIGILERIVQEDPGNAEALIDLGEFYANQAEDADTEAETAREAGNLDRAEERDRRASELFQKAAFQFEEAARFDDHAFNAKVAHAQMLAGNREFNEAITLLREALRIKDDTRIENYLNRLEQAARSL